MDIISFLLGYTSGKKGGGSSEAIVEPLTVTKNGTYIPGAGVDGFAPVSVAVESGGGSCGDDIIASGVFASGVTWKLDSNGIFTVSGTGAMDDYTSEEERPWNDVADQIRAVVIEKGVTHIGSYAFAGGRIRAVYLHQTIRNDGVLLNDGAVQSIGDRAFLGLHAHGIVLPQGLKTIGNYAFSGSHLYGIEFPYSVTDIGDGVFQLCTNLRYAKFGSNVASIGKAAFYLASNMSNAKFSDTSTWYVGDNAGDTTTAVAVTSETTAATYLTSTYVAKYWTKV